jgi:hypothetical protein
MANWRCTVSRFGHQKADRRFVSANARSGGARSEAATTGLGLLPTFTSGPNSQVNPKVDPSVKTVFQLI